MQQIVKTDIFRQGEMNNRETRFSGGGNMEKTDEVIDRRVARYIRITDDLKWEYIDRIMQRGEYRHSFNKVINDALDYGLPQLLKVANGETEQDRLPSTEQQGYEQVVDDLDSEKLTEIVDLLEEILLNESLIKSMTASLFNERGKQLSGCTVKPQSFENGNLRDTPPYLAEHERMVMDEVNKSRRKRLSEDGGGD